MTEISWRIPWNKFQRNFCIILQQSKNKFLKKYILEKCLLKFLKQSLNTEGVPRDISDGISGESCSRIPEGISESSLFEFLQKNPDGFPKIRFDDTPEEFSTEITFQIHVENKPGTIFKGIPREIFERKKLLKESLDEIARQMPVETLSETHSVVGDVGQSDSYSAHIFSIVS